MNFYKYDACHSPRTMTRRNSLGWGGVVKAVVERPWAGFLDGNILRTKAGAVRTFATR